MLVEGNNHQHNLVTTRLHSSEFKLSHINNNKNYKKQQQQFETCNATLKIGMHVTRVSMNVSEKGDKAETARANKKASKNKNEISFSQIFFCFIFFSLLISFYV